MKIPKHVYGVSLLTAVCLAACTSENAFEPSSGNMKSSIAFAVGVDEGGSNATRGAEPESFVVDSFVVDNQTVYLTCTVSDLSSEDKVETEPLATRGTPIYTSPSAATEGNAKIFNLSSVYGEFNVSAFLNGNISTPLKQNYVQDGTTVDPSTTESFINIPFTFEASEYTDQHTAYEYWRAKTSAESPDTPDAGKFFWWKDDRHTANDYKLTFFAYAPTTSVKKGNTWSGLTIANSNFKANGCIEFNYEVPKAVTDYTGRDAEMQPDILVASTGKTPLSRPAPSKIYENSVLSTDEYYVVPLTFCHALCGVRFKVGAFDPIMAGSSIQSITLSNLQNTGKCVFDPSATPKFTWTPNDGSRTGTYTQTFGEGTLGTSATDVREGDMAYKANNQKTFMLIPQSFGSTGSEVDVTIRFSKNGIIDERTTQFKNYTWKAGKLYTYTFETKKGGVELSVSDSYDASTQKKSGLVITNEGTATSYVRVALTGNWVSNSSVNPNPSIPYDPTKWSDDLDDGVLNTTDWTEGADGYYYYKHPLLGKHSIQPENTLFDEITFSETAPYSDCHLEVMVVVQAVRASQVEDAWGTGIKSTLGLDTTIKD